jgi:hypothetical protein
MLINPRRKGFAFASTVLQASVLLLAAREVRGAIPAVGFLGWQTVSWETRKRFLALSDE